MFGETDMGIANWPPVPIYQEARNIFAVLVQCATASANNIRVGYADQQPIELRPGESITLPVGNLALVYVQGDGGAATINWLAMT